MFSLFNGPWQSRPSSRRRSSTVRFPLSESLEPRVVLDGSGFVSADPVAQPALSITAEAITPPTTSYLPGEAFNALKFAPNGQLSLILWNNDVLEFRVRNGSGQWGVEKIADNIYTGDGFGVGANQPYRDKEQAQLLFAPDGTPHVLMLTPEGVAHFLRDPVLGWLKVETIALPGNTTNSFNPLYENLQAAVGPGGALHFMAIFNRYEANGFQNPADGSTIYYGTNVSGSWAITEAANLPDAPNRYHPSATSSPRAPSRWPSTRKTAFMPSSDPTSSRSRFPVASVC